MNTTIRCINSLKGFVNIPGDKSIAHRSIILNSIANGRAKIKNFPLSQDCLKTVDAMKSLGARIYLNTENCEAEVYGRGLKSLSSPSDIIDVGNSGTTARLLIGLLAGQSFSSTITGDTYLNKRPMSRVVMPLEYMGASLEYTKNYDNLPISIRPSEMQGIDYTLPVASAQVKSAILLATLYARSPSIIRGDNYSRNHTELMLKAMGADIVTEDDNIYLSPVNNLSAHDIYVPCDISSAAFFITAGLIVPDSSITIKNVGLNKTRSGILDIYDKMGGNIEFKNVQETAGELKGDITAFTSALTSLTIEGDIIPRLIDEIPIIALAATQAIGTTIIKDAKELTVKESDRIQSTTEVLSRLGANIRPTDDGMIIKGPTPLSGNTVNSMGDHRIAMMAAIAALIADGKTIIEDSHWIDVSFPGYLKALQSLISTNLFR